MSVPGYGRGVSFAYKHKKGNAAANDTPSIAKDCKVPLAGLLPNGSALPVVKIVVLLHNQELQ